RYRVYAHDAQPTRGRPVTAIGEQCEHAGWEVDLGGDCSGQVRVLAVAVGEAVLAQVHRPVGEDHRPRARVGGKPRPKLLANSILTHTAVVLDCAWVPASTRRLAVVVKHAVTLADGATLAVVTQLRLTRTRGPCETVPSGPGPGG